MVRHRNGLRYTRDGSFHRAQAGQLVTGRASRFCRVGQDDSVPPGEVTVGADGRSRWRAGRWPTVGVFDISGGNRADTRGRQPLHRAGGSDGGGRQRDASVHQGAIEAANQDVVQGTLDLIVMQRQAEMMQRALTVFHTEFNKFAT